MNSFFDKAIAGFDGSGETINSQGIAMLSSSKHLRATDWILSVNAPLSEAYAPVRSLRNYLLAGILIGTIAMLGIAWLVMRVLTAPLAAVTREVEAMGTETELVRQLSYSSSDEVGRLAQAFNGMVAALGKKQADLQERENNFRALAETASNGMLVIKGNGSFAYGNYHGAKTLGYSVEELLTCGISDLAHPDDLPFLMERFHKIIAWEKVPKTYETRMVRKDGTVIPVEVSSSLTIWHEESADLVIFSDISDRKRGEAEIRDLNKVLQQHVEELANANRELEAFGYSLSHDLRGPLSSIYCAAQALADLYAEKLDETGNFFLDGICKASERMDEIINAMSLLSRVSQSELEQEQIDVSDLVTQILLRFSMEDQQRKARAVVAPGVTVTADLPLLKSALENLLGNAWKYTRKNPTRL